MKQQRVFSFFNNFVPYYKDLHHITKSVLSSILAARLQYLFERVGYGNGFIKFLEPCDHKDYLHGESWTEELGFSTREFNTAFDNIGVTYDSKKDYEFAKKTEGNPFNKLIETPQYEVEVRKNEKSETVVRRKKISSEFTVLPMYFCRYVDKKSNLTWYFKNYDCDILDDALNLISSSERERRSAANQNPISAPNPEEKTDFASPQIEKGDPWGSNKAIPRDRETRCPPLYVEKSNEKKAVDAFTENQNQPQPQDQKQENPNAEPLPTETRSDCAAPPTGGLRTDSEWSDPSLDSIGVGEDRPSWVRYVAAYYNTRDEHSILKHLKAADKVSELTGEKVAAWCARCGSLAEWLRSNVDGSFFGKTNGRAHSNGHSNGHANGNGKAAPQFKHATAPAQSIDEKTLVLMAVIAQVTFKNLTIKQHSELCQAAAVELAKVGATCEIITAKFGNGSWWYQKDWRGQKGSCPTPAQLIEVWGQWENTNAGNNGATNGAASRGTGNRILGNILRHDPNKPVDTRVYDTTLPYFPDAIAI